MLADRARQGASGLKEFEFLGSTSTATDKYSGETHSFASQSLGRPHNERYIILGFNTTCSDTFTPSSVSIGGVTATQLADSSYSGTTTIERCWYYYAKVTTGTTGTISVTWTGNASPNRVYRLGLAWYRLVGYSMTLHDSTITSSDTPASTLTLDVDTAAHGVTLAQVHWQNATGTPTWSGIPEDDLLDTETTDYAAFASTRTSAELARSISNSITSTTSGGAGISISFSPIA